MWYEYFMNASVLRSRRTKIVATLGPASSTLEMIEKLFVAGVDVFRLNFSHGTHADHQIRFNFIREIEKKYNRPIGIIADLQGPKLRVGRFKNDSIALKVGMKIRLDLDPTEGDETRVCLPHREVISGMPVGSQILLDDGKVRMEIVARGTDFLTGEVKAGHKLSNNKGFNVPGVILPIDALTEKDRLDLAAALDMGVDWIAQSFVQTADDVAQARALIGQRAGLLVKIEKPSALEHLDKIIELADAVMLARGDLGVEIPPEDVPTTQKKVVRKVRHIGKPVIVATQMLESMIDNATPTRAEASDVATAVYDGTDAVMLSAETAAGLFPIEAVKIMDRICQRVERDETYRRIIDADHPPRGAEGYDAITSAADNVAKDVQAVAIVNYTISGTTVRRTARQRPAVPILCLTPVEQVARKAALYYGVHPVVVGNVTRFKEAVQEAVHCAKAQGLAKIGENLVLTAGVPFGTPGSTNILRIVKVD